jgi:hypothetical protein
MHRAIRNVTAGNVDVHGIGQVVVRVVTVLRMHGLRFLDAARFLRVRLARRMAAALPVGSSSLYAAQAVATCTSEPTGSGRCLKRRDWRCDGPGAALGFGRF